MTVQIFTSVVNRPDFLEIQAKAFKKFLQDDYQFNVVDDSLDEKISKEFKEVSEKYNITYYKKPIVEERKIHTPISGSDHVDETIQWTFDEIIKKKHPNDVVFFSDSDMFLLEEFSIKDYMKGEIVAGHLQSRGLVRYIWNGIMFFDMSKIMKIDPDLNFSHGVVDGEPTDTGGSLHYYFKRNNINFKNINEGGTTPDDCPEYPTEYKGIEIPVLLNPDMWSQPKDGFQFELHLNGKFLHYRAGTNWHTKKNWKTKEDPIKIKAKIFNQIVSDFID